MINSKRKNKNFNVWHIDFHTPPDESYTNQFQHLPRIAEPAPLGVFKYRFFMVSQFISNIEESKVVYGDCIGFSYIPDKDDKLCHIENISKLIDYVIVYLLEHLPENSKKLYISYVSVNPDKYMVYLGTKTP